MDLSRNVPVSAIYNMALLTVGYHEIIDRWIVLVFPVHALLHSLLDKLIVMI